MYRWIGRIDIPIVYELVLRELKGVMIEARELICGEFDRTSNY
jgi:hypothetical protein